MMQRVRDGRRTGQLRHGERGSALVLALFAIVALLLLGTVFLATSLSEKRVAGNETLAARAFGIAEAGLEHGRIALASANVDNVLALGGTLLSNQSLGGGTYTVVITNNLQPPFPLGTVPADLGGATDDTDGYLILTSTGTYQTARRQTEVIVRQNQISFGNQALFGDTFVTDSGSAGINGSVGSNGNISTGSQSISGNATAHGTVTGTVSGTVTQGAPLVSLPLVGCPGGAYGGPALTGAPAVFNAVTGDITFASALDTGMPAGTYYYHNFIHTGSGRITVASGASVTIYISGQMTLGGGGTSNANNHAANLQILGCGGDTTTWSETNISAPTQYYTIYAPTHPMRFTGSSGSDFNGAVVAKSIDQASGMQINYDSGVVIGSPTFNVVAGSWAEVLQ